MRSKTSFYTQNEECGRIVHFEAQKSSDMFMKCRYMDELTGGRGVVLQQVLPYRTL